MRMYEQLDAGEILRTFRLRTPMYMNQVAAGALDDAS